MNERNAFHRFSFCYGMTFEKEHVVDILSRDLESATFTDCTLIGTDARNTKFIDCTFERSTLSSVRIDGAVLQAKFLASKIEGVNFFTAKRELLSLEFENCLIRYSSFAELKLKETKFT